MKSYKKNEQGIALLITLLLTGVLLGMSSALLNLALKQYQLAGISLSSEAAFQAANAGLECILFHENPVTGDSIFSVNSDGSTVPEEVNVSCMGGQVSADISLPADNTVRSGEEQRFQFTWGTASNQVCSEVSVYKFSSAGSPVPVVVNGRTYRSPCPAGSVCTVVQARGYNVACNQVNTNPRVVEREYVQIY